MLLVSPKGTVPVLVLNDGTVLDQSLDIMHWAINSTYPSASDPNNWMAAEIPTIGRRLIEANDTEAEKRNEKGTTGKKAEKNFKPMQPGDVVGTAANIDKLHKVNGFKPTTDIEQGIQKFVDWYREFYRV